MSIVQAGDPVLRQKTAYYDGQLGDDLLQRLIGRMRETMEQIQGGPSDWPRRRSGFRCGWWCWRRRRSSPTG
ncbi:hypothetical protein ACFY2M_37140 [Streptomyces sp. NPDC001276]|uniref:hypothetical protein n=1 Tax=Streptomyces sp. NPDC001276 TaxID=3364555 RepID=UPI0036A04B2F